MSAATSSSSLDPESRSLQMLIEVFGSRFSLEDIATAYCQASCNVDAAGEILFAKTGDTSDHEDINAIPNSTETNWASNLQNPHQVDKNSRTSKSKRCSVSVGTIGSVIGKDYVRTRPSATAPHEATKPVKLDSKDIPMGAIWNDDQPPSTKANSSRLQGDVEEFILKMLGEGFQVNSATISEVLGACGYDVKKSMEELLDLSAKSMAFSNEVVSTSHMEQLQQQDFAKSNEEKRIARNSTDLLKRNKDNVDLQREILESLFTVPDIHEENRAKKSIVRPVRRYGQPVVKPFEDPTWERVVSVGQDTTVDDDENGYEALRKAAEEYWLTMKEYYNHAVEAFVNGDEERANRLMKEGHFFKSRAREADQKSIAKLVEASEHPEPACQEQEIMSLDLHDLEPKEALRLLKVHLTSFSGISSFKYLRITVGASEDEAKGPRKRLMVKLLEKESIEWVEEDKGLKMLIRVDVINPKNLSFGKKK